VSISGARGLERPSPGPRDTHVTLDPHRQRISYHPFITDASAASSPAIQRDRNPRRTGLAERTDPRAPSPPHSTSPWDELHLAYFSGYSMWNYLTLPFLLTHPSVQVRELDPWSEDGQTMATPGGDIRRRSGHAQRVQPLLRPRRPAAPPRLHPDVLGGGPAANYSDGHKTFAASSFPPAARSPVQSRRNDIAGTPPRPPSTCTTWPCAAS